MNQPDAHWVALALDGDDRVAFGVLVQRHQGAVRAFLRHLERGQSSSADDLAQETFLVAHRQLARFRPENTFVTWLLGIARNLHRNADRQARRRPQETLSPELPQEGVDQATAYAQTDELTQALARLSPQEQEIFHLHYYQGLRQEEVATLLDLPIGTVKSQLSRGKEKLRQLLTP